MGNRFARAATCAAAAATLLALAAPAQAAESGPPSEHVRLSTCTVINDMTNYYADPGEGLIWWVDAGQNIDMTGNYASVGDEFYGEGWLWGDTSGQPWWVETSNLDCS